MGYSDLYEFCRGLSPKIKRNLVRNKVVEIEGIKGVRTIMTSLDTSSCRGFYLSPRNVSHPLVRDHGCNIIVLARGMEPRHERFIFVKELMHVFDDPLESTDTPALFESTLNNIYAANINAMSPQVRSEYNALWMALAVLCPQAYRDGIIKKRGDGTITDVEIADELDIPIGYVSSLFSDSFESSLSAILKSK